MSIFPLASWPRAILHVDGDSFFVSCEQSVDASLRGKPVVTGAERGIVSAASYEAKALGITRAMKLTEVKRRFPECIILPSNYELYSTMSVRMHEIVGRYTDQVEEYSIDECFADVTGMRRPLGGKSYQQIAAALKHDLESELSMSFSVGISVTKTLAKVASNFDKPSGCVAISGKDVPTFLHQISLREIWGIGKQSATFFESKRLKTALDVARLDEQWVGAYLHEPLRIVWSELRGNREYEVTVGKKRTYKSIQKTKTFSPSSKSRSKVLSELSKNIENACIKLRRYGLKASGVSFFLKTNDFIYRGLKVRLDMPVCTPSSLITIAEDKFDQIFRTGEVYRSTGVTLFDLGSGEMQMDLFGETVHITNVEKLYGVVDALDAKLGKHTVFLGSSMEALTKRPITGRHAPATRWKKKLKGETARKRLNIPIIGSVG